MTKTMTNKELATKIVELLGGVENIVHAENCMTRIRVNIRDSAKADPAAIKALEGVVGVVADEDDYIQVVLGPGKVRNIMNICTEELGLKEAINKGTVDGDWQSKKAEVKAGQKNSSFINKIRILADIFTPMIPAFIASGMCNGLGKLIKIFMDNGVLPSGTAMVVTYNIFVLVGNAFLSYMAIFTGVRAAKQFGVNEMLGGMIGAASLNTVINTISKTIGWYAKRSSTIRFLPLAQAE